MGSPILASSNLPIIGVSRCSRKWANKTDGHKILPMNQSKCLRLHLTEKWAPNSFRNIAYLQRLMSHSLAISKTFAAHQNKDCPLSTEVLSNWPFILWLQRTALCAWWFTFWNRQRSTSWYEIMHLPILGNLLILGDFSLVSQNYGMREEWYNLA